MQVYFTIGDPRGPDDDGVEFTDLEGAFRAAGRAVLRLASEVLDDSGAVRLNVYTDEGLVGYVTAALTTTRGAPRLARSNGPFRPT
jgi:hypothetical protein